MMWLHRLYVSEAKCRKLYLYIIFIKVWQLLYFPQWPIGGGEIWLFSQEKKFEIFFSVLCIYIYLFIMLMTNKSLSKLKPTIIKQITPNQTNDGLRWVWLSVWYCLHASELVWYKSVLNLAMWLVLVWCAQSYQSWTIWSQSN